ncbi:uncharacterized protein A4U43_C01F5920 [Asparagus officinalis]|uniref:EF-1-gamma C-terminal domain-containing protein n=1 Tax=Asparagus officinalis TaxID=4686 RepID=A0A5P1FM54_ASPOF|nr:uncharacterized protein A4U43_C01F5920 [Asparagus officinalis]
MPKEAKKEVKKEPAKEEEEAPKPKPKNSLDLLPPSKMILDEWKRLYSNTKTNFREVAIKVVQSLKMKLRRLKMKKQENYDKMDKTESMRVEIRSKKARKIIADTMKISNSPGQKSFAHN